MSITNQMRSQSSGLRDFIVRLWHVDFFELRDKGAELFTLEFMSGSLRKKPERPREPTRLRTALAAGRKADRQLGSRSRHAGFLP